MFLSELFEGHSILLYHGTSIYSAGLILKSGVLEPHTSHMFDGEVKTGISTSRSYKFAKEWAGSGVVFVLDGQKLKNDYSILEKDYFQHHHAIDENTEEEDFVVTNKPIPLDKYLVEIIATHREWVDALQTTMAGNNRHKDFAFQLLHDHPKFKVKESVQPVQEKTLYHGTDAQSAANITKTGLMPTAGSFTNGFYADYGEVPELTFAADKKGLQAAVNAMVFAVGKKLGKQAITHTDIRNHGALGVIKDGDEYFSHKPRDEQGQYEWEMDNEYENLHSVEPGDYYSDDWQEVDMFLKGPAMIRYLKKFDMWPIEHGRVR